jgi:signal peptide peptidase SppA
MEAQELARLVSLHNDIEKVKAEASRKELHEITAIIKSETEDSGSLYYIENGEAHIPIVGQLSEKPSVSAQLFGEDQTTYGSIIDNIEKAEADPSVSKIIFDTDSPGGTVSGVDQTAMAIRSASKPTQGRVHNMAASGAYWLISQTDEIVAMTPSVEVGSIGVAVEISDYKKYDESKGISRHVITSSDAPDKRADVGTEEGRDKIQARLNDIHDVFVKRVSEGRNVSAEKINKDFGHGGMVIASKALDAGMIDAVIDGAEMVTASGANKTKAAQPAEGAGINNEEVMMDMTKDQLKAENPGLYKEIFEAGVNAERDRVTAHLNMGEPAGAMEAAIKHIKDGDEFTSAIGAEYMAANMNKGDLEARDKDEPEKIETEAEPDIETKAKDIASQVVALGGGA